jgi:glycosyltransferase involved in cell wall biosynthesis
MRVAHFIQRYPPALGGSEAYFARLSRYLASAGDEVTVFTTTAIDLTAFWSRHGATRASGLETEDGVTVRRFPLWHLPGRRYLLKAASFIPLRHWQCLTLPCNPISWSMWRASATPEPAFDVVHASAFPYAWPIMCGLRLARRRGIPFFLTPFLHLGDPYSANDRTRRAYLQPALRWLLRQADIVFAQTEGERRAILECGLPADRVLLQGLGVDARECTGGDRGRARAGWGVAADELVIGHLANNSEEKGTCDLLRAAELLWQAGQRFTIVLAGPQMPSFERFWSSYQPKGRVCRLGVLDEPGKRDFYAGLDLFALPSRSDSFGLVLLEAWANGLANVAYRAGGVAEVIRHEQDGLLAPSGSVPELAGAMERLLRDRNLRESFGRAGQQRARRELHWEPKLALVREAYDNQPRSFSHDAKRSAGLVEPTRASRRG